MTAVSIAKDFSPTPGGRFRKHGPYSGEQFREEILLPALRQALESNGELIVDFDGLAGAPSSFLEEAFGGLVRTYGDVDVSKLVLKTSSNGLKPYVTIAYRFINEARKQPK